MTGLAAGRHPPRPWGRLGLPLCLPPPTAPRAALSAVSPWLLPVSQEQQLTDKAPAKPLTAFCLASKQSNAEQPCAGCCTGRSSAHRRPHWRANECRPRERQVSAM